VQIFFLAASRSHKIGIAMRNRLTDVIYSFSNALSAIYLPSWLSLRWAEVLAQRLATWEHDLCFMRIYPFLNPRKNYRQYTEVCQDAFDLPYWKYRR
jgi:hypothetical protein